jgi:hypothetical protein
MRVRFGLRLPPVRGHGRKRCDCLHAGPLCDSRAHELHDTPQMSRWGPSSLQVSPWPRAEASPARDWLTRAGHCQLASAFDALPWPCLAMCVRRWHRVTTRPVQLLLPHHTPPSCRLLGGQSMSQWETAVLIRAYQQCGPHWRSELLRSPAPGQPCTTHQSAPATTPVSSACLPDSHAARRPRNQPKPTAPHVGAVCTLASAHLAPVH